MQSEQKMSAADVKQVLDSITNYGGRTMFLVRQVGVPLDVQLDELLGENLRCPQGLSSKEWLQYFKRRLGDCGLRPQDYAD